MKWKEQLLTLAPYEPGKPIEEVQKEFNLDRVVKLASNENPFGCSKHALQALKNIDSELALYPDGNATFLREIVAEKYNLEPNQLIFGNGSDNLIQMISRALLSNETNTVMAKPTFSQYKHNAIIEGTEIREVPLTNDGLHDLDAMLAAIDEKTTVVWLCSPNNPTGTYIRDGEIQKFLRSVPKNCLVVLDEAYYEYVVAEDYYDALELVKEFDNLIVLRTFSKIYGLASIRVGYGIANKDIIRTLEPTREPFNTNRLSHTIAAAAIKDDDFVNKCRQANKEGLKQFYEFCEKHNLHYFESQGNFILIDFEEDGNKLFQAMLEKGFIIRSGVPLGFPTSVRITVGSEEENASVIAALEQYLLEK